MPMRTCTSPKIIFELNDYYLRLISNRGVVSVTNLSFGSHPFANRAKTLICYVRVFPLNVKWQPALVIRVPKLVHKSTRITRSTLSPEYYRL